MKTKRSLRLAALALGLLAALPAAAAGQPRPSVCGKARWEERWGNPPPPCTRSDLDDDGSPDVWVAYQPPPAAPGSRRFKIWHVKGDRTAAAAAPTVLSLLHKRYQPLVELFGREPLSDAGCPCDGGDGRMDIYLLPEQDFMAPLFTQVTGFPVEQLCAQPAYIKIDRNYYRCPSELLEPAIGHELAHTFQHSYRFAPPCLWEADGKTNPDPVLSWLRESTARWSEWHFFRGNPTGVKFQEGICRRGKPYAEEYLHEKLREPLPDDAYAGWMFPLFLSLRHGAQIVPRVWKRLETERDVARAIESVVAEMAGREKWEETWPEFSAANLNVPPVDEYARIGIPAQARRDVVQVSVGDGLAQVPLPSPEVPPLAAHHYEVKVGDTVHLLAFETGLGEEAPQALRLQALPRMAGQPRRRPEDWTHRGTVSFCRDRPQEKVEDVFLVLSNGGWSKGAPPLGAPAARWLASDLYCGPWKGRFTLTSEGSGQLGDFAGGEERHQVEVDAVFEPAGAGLDEEGFQVALAGRGTLVYRWSGKVTVGGRTATCGGERTVRFGPGGALLQLRHTRDGRRQYQVVGQTEIEGAVGVGCDGKPAEGGRLLWAWSQDWLPLGSPTAAHHTKEESGEGGKIVFSWSLAAEAPHSPPGDPGGDDSGGDDPGDDDPPGGPGDDGQTGGGDGGGPRRCRSNADCLEALQFCDFQPGTCGRRGAGTCSQKPKSCPKQRKPVCGCDRVTYANDCLRRQAGVLLKARGRCPAGR